MVFGIPVKRDILSISERCNRGAEIGLHFINDGLRDPIPP
jgi:hypothetical protein